MEKKKYSEEKIRENLDCEIFDICLNEAEENKKGREKQELVIETLSAIPIPKSLNVKQTYSKFSIKKLKAP